ncbi:cardiolipin synthase ClsB [Lysobacter tyrosinilyticus]
MWTSPFSWRGGNRVAVLENGEEFFARVFAAIDDAQREVLIETFILFEDKIGMELQRRLIAAARRGVKVEVTVDGFGSPQFSTEFLSALSEAGVKLRVFDPQPRWLGMRLNLFRRMHRKLVVADERVALVGGINYSADHVMDFGAEAKQDYAVVIEGPVVADIHSFLRVAMGPPGTGEAWRPSRGTVESAPRGSAEVMFAVRDNHRYSRSIEREYRRAIRAAREEIVIANAYFFPGYGFLRDLRHAAKRGVKVSLIFQGEPDTKVALAAARSLYRHLVDAGVRVFEYCERPFHGKIAAIDDGWATVGSSNLDPLSLSLNLEANVFIRDREFVADLRARLGDLMQSHCHPVDPVSVPRGRFWQVLARPLLFHCLRRFPTWAGWMPAHTQRIALAKPSSSNSEPQR